MFICFLCEMDKYPEEKIMDDGFIFERLDEFYPLDEYGGCAQICDNCFQKYDFGKHIESKKNY